MEYENYIDSEQPIMKKERRKYYTSNIIINYLYFLIRSAKFLILIIFQL